MNNLPMGWVEVKMGNISYPSQYGYTAKASDIGEVKYLRTTDITKGEINWENVPFCEISDKEKDKYLLKNGDIVISRAGSVGFSYLVDNIENQAVFASYLIRFRFYENLSKKYISHFLKSSDYWQQISNHSAGNALQNVNAKKLAEICLPLPPKAEQDHIATLLDNHLSQVAKIEQKLKDILLIIKQFRQSVLAQAVSGKLLADLDFENWQTVKLSDISQIKGGKRLPKGHELLSEKTPYPYIRVTDFDNASVNLDNLKYLSEETHNLIKNYTISKNDLYISIAGTIGLVGEIPEILDGANLTENSAKICDIKPEVSKDFLKLCLNSYQVKEQFDDKVTSSGQPKLALFRIRDCVISLPPLPEQQQIVAIVERLFALADNIEKQVNEALERVSYLTQSILHQAFTGNLSADWRKENSELITGEHSATALLAQISLQKQSPQKRKANKD